jgi:glycosyltransferase involved in cell wall biosynthesis
MTSKGQFVVATPTRSPLDPHAVALHQAGLLRLLALGTRRGVAGVPRETTDLNPLIGLTTYAATCVVSSFKAESFRFRLLPWFDTWVKRRLQPGDHIISSFGYANECFSRVQAQGGKTFVDGGNSHPEHYWKIVGEEYARWKCSLPAMPRFWYRRAVEMMPLVDYVLSPSQYVTSSFLANGFKPEQIFHLPYPVNLENFQPAITSRPANRPLTIISTGAPSLRKGTPYLLEAFRLVRRKHPSAKLILNNAIHQSVAPLLKQFSDLPIEWPPSLPHAQLANLLRSADIFVLPSIEEGMVRTALEAMACGLPVILTPNTGTSDFVQPGVNGEVVPIRDVPAISEAILKWADRLLSERERPAISLNREMLSFERFECSFLRQLTEIGLIAGFCAETPG